MSTPAPNLYVSFASRKSIQLIAPVKQDVPGAPPDKFAAAYLSYWFLGTGILYPWNCFLTALDYFFVVYPGRNIDRMFTIVYFPSNLLFLTICTLFHHKMNIKLRINSGYFLFIVAVAIPLMINYLILHGSTTGTDLTFALTLLGAAVAGTGDGVSQGALFADSSVLPPQYIQSVSLGTATAGVLVFVMRCITKASFGDTPEGLRDGAMLYYCISIVLCAVCLVLYAFVLYNIPIVKYYRSKIGVYEPLEEDKEVQMAALGEAEEGDYAPSKPMAKPHDAGSEFARFKRLFLSVWLLSVSMIVIYANTLFIFPGVMMMCTPPLWMGSWYYVMVIGIYNIGDLLGKAAPFFPQIVITSPTWIFAWSAVRLGFIPIFLVIYKADMGVVMLLVTLIFGITNGYLTTVALMVGPEGMEPEDQEAVTNLLVWFLIFGLACGAFLSFLWLIPGFLWT